MCGTGCAGPIPVCSSAQVRDVLNVFHHLEQKRAGATNFAVLDIYSQRYTTLKERLIRAEREILKELGFVLYTEHPHKFILNYCKLLTLERDTPRLAQQAWNFINDSQRTNVCIKFAPEVICCAAIWMAARVLQLVLPPKWWELFDAAKEDMDAVCEQVLALYSRPKARFVKLEAPPAPGRGADGQDGEGDDTQENRVRK